MTQQYVVTERGANRIKMGKDYLSAGDVVDAAGWANLPSYLSRGLLAPIVLTRAAQDGETAPPDPPLEPTDILAAVEAGELNASEALERELRLPEPRADLVRQLVMREVADKSVDKSADTGGQEPPPASEKAADKKPRKKPQPTPLPEGFPGKHALEGAQFTTLEQVRTLSFDELRAVPGIGEVTARNIMTALAAPPTEEE
jgi:predicted flap endonuclease-1-like 5' DNA nuclease